MKSIFASIALGLLAVAHATVAVTAAAVDGGSVSGGPCKAKDEANSCTPFRVTREFPMNNAPTGRYCMRVVTKTGEIGFESRDISTVASWNCKQNATAFTLKNNQLFLNNEKVGFGKNNVAVVIRRDMKDVQPASFRLVNGADSVAYLKPYFTSPNQKEGYEYLVVGDKLMRVPKSQPRDHKTKYSAVTVEFKLP